MTFIVLILSIFLLNNCESKKTDYKKNSSSLEMTNPIYKQGKLLYKRHCQSCHIYRGKGGLLGPSLDNMGAKNQDGTMIREHIIEPNRIITKGYKINTMPSDFSKKLNNTEIDALIFYLTN